MARKTGKNKRTEPRFTDSPSSGTRPSKSGGVSRRKQSRRSSRAKNPARPSLLWRFIRFCLRPLPRLTYWGAVFGLWGGIIAIGIIGFHAAHLPNADDWAIPERPPNMRIVAHDATLISNRGLTGGKALRLEDMSPYIPQAVIAIEDHRFYSHFGFDPIGFGRAMFRNAMQKRLREGGSTITQQLAKNLFLTPDRTFGRKVQELVLSFWLEANFTKAEILELYLNRVYFGAGATGVDAAARRYFGKAARDVTIAEAAMLAGLLKAPSRFSPARNPKLAQRRAETVLAAMQREGFIKSGAIDMSRIKPGENARHFRSGPEHFAADMIVKQVHKLLGAVDQDIVVETTLSPYMMTAAHEILAGSLDANGERRKVSQAALVAMAPNGAIRALIGGRDYGKSQFNRAVEARRQPGSAFKPFVWLNAVERGYEPKSMLQDTPVRYGKWRPENYDQTYRGSVSLADALAESVNTIAARLTVEAGPDRIAATARRLGVESKMVSNASLALGTSELSLLELTAAYAPFANGGVRAEPHLISRITTGSGKLLFQRKPTRSIQVVRPRELGMMNTMLKRVVQRGTGRNARLKGHIAGGKTGTSQGFRDALFVGHTSYLVTGIWFGNDNNQSTRKITGGSLPALAWKEFMTAALHDLPLSDLPGQPYHYMGLPRTIPMPKSRPAHRNRPNLGTPVDDQKTASLRQRVNAVLRKKSQTTIYDLIVGN